MPGPETSRLAVLIDADNTSARHASALMEEVAKYGVPTVKRAYGDWTTQNLVGWKAKLNEHAIQPMQQFAYTTGKNSTDSALIIDAMDLLYSGNLDAFAIVSSDSDFTRLVTRLRESGKTVYGLGLRKTPTSLQNACDRFIFLELLDVEAAAPVAGSGRSGGPDGSAEPGESGESGGSAGSGGSADDRDAGRRPDLRRILTTAIDSTSHDDGWASLSAVGSHISKNNPAFDARDYGAPKLVELVRKQAYVDVDQPDSGPVRVRISVARPARRRPAVGGS